MFSPKFFLKSNPGDYILHVRKVGDTTNELLGSTKVKIGKDRVLNDIIHIDNFPLPPENALK